MADRVETKIGAQLGRESCRCRRLLPRTSRHSTRTLLGSHRSYVLIEECLTARSRQVALHSRDEPWLIEIGRYGQQFAMHLLGSLCDGALTVRAVSQSDIVARLEWWAFLADHHAALRRGRTGRIVPGFGRPVANERRCDLGDRPESAPALAIGDNDRSLP